MNYLFIVLLIMLSAYFSGSEIAFASAGELRLRRRAQETGRLPDVAALKVKERYDKALITILIGNNLVNIASSSVATVIAVALMGDRGAWAATAVMTVVVLTFGEILPKILASAKPGRFARAASVPALILMYVTWPLVWVFEKIVSGASFLWRDQMDTGPEVTEDDLETIIDTVEEEGVVDEDTADMLQSALDFDDLLAYEVITPRVDMVAVDIDDDFDEQAKVLMDSHYSRVPVYRDTVDNVVGIVNLNRWLTEVVHGRKPSVEEVMTEPLFVHKTMPLPDVLELMKREKCHLVIVTDEYGGVDGVLTLEDVLEQLVGDIWDETDEKRPEFEEIGPNLYMADGEMRIYDLFDELDIDDRDFDDDNTTIGGWALEMLEGYPQVGDSFDYKNLTITVAEIEERRVMALMVRENPVPEEDEEDDLI